MSIRYNLIEYRVPISATLLVLALASMFVLTSQSGSSLVTYVFAIFTLAGLKSWSSLFLDWAFILVVVLLTYIPLTIFWSAPWNAGQAFGLVVRAVLVLCFVVAIAEGFRVDWFRGRLNKVMALAGGLAALAALAVYVIDPPVDGRLFGLGQLDVHVRAALVFGVCLVSTIAWVIEEPSWRQRSLAVVLGIILISAIVLSGSRNAWASVTLGVVTFVAAVVTSSPRAFGWMVAAGATIMAVVIVVLISSTETRDMLLPRGLSFRPAIWAAAIDDVLAHGPVFGRGVLTPDSVRVDGLEFRHQHSLYIAVFHQGGVVALVLFGALTAVAIVSLLRHFEHPQAKLALGILAIALPSYTLDGYELVDKIGWSWLLYWLPIAISLGLRNSAGLRDAKRFSPE
ncbi:MAG: O-antigen ligase family protein [Gammaproteobacteria bacterium]|nr:O-antigen ligase family protein [Gammaproteobacteria bacterium]